VRFYYKDRNFLETREEIEQYMSTSTKPDALLPFKELVVKDELNKEITREAK
jgi:hypothetical protein